MQKWLINNLWLKVVSLILAIITWFYIYGELTKRPIGYYPRSQVVPNPQG